VTGTAPLISALPGIRGQAIESPRVVPFWVPYAVLTVANSVALTVLRNPVTMAPGAK